MTQKLKISFVDLKVMGMGNDNLWHFSYFCFNTLSWAILYISLCKKIDFQDGLIGCHLGFPIETILAVFDLQVTLMLPTKFRVNWPFTSGEEAKNRFSKWLPCWPSWISNRDDFSYF